MMAASSARYVRTLRPLAAVLLSFAAPLRAQSPGPALWQRDSIHSAVLHASRYFRVATPPNYDDNVSARERYPVLVVLDAEDDLFFSATVAAVRAWSAFGPPRIPRMIVVGVENADRFADMTTPAFARAIQNPRAGKEPAFLRFLSSELLPRIATRYRTLPYVIIAGHSLSGLFATWAFGEAPTVFSAGIALSPSFPLANGISGREALDAVSGRSRPGRFFVLTSAEEPLDSAAQVFARTLRSRQPAGLAFEYQRVPQGSHIQTELLGLMPGLEFVFRPISLAGYFKLVRLQNTNASPESLVAFFDRTRAAYAKGARDLGLPERLPLQFLLNQSTLYQNSTVMPLRLRICQDLAASYPELWNGFACEGDAQARMGDTTRALRSYRRAIQAAARAHDAHAADSLASRARKLGGSPRR